jgi:hypothetical protein
LSGELWFWIELREAAMPFKMADDDDKEANCSDIYHIPAIIIVCCCCTRSAPVADL